ncbi:NAD(P)-binding domain-containing protein [Streptomyces sp. NPDC048278]|uniref:NADPH-dependent F420 reductase n=1 Tax=Streptomyces sp. NPDC048278 TaxID=3155809 RepID=UPI003421F039
MTRTLGLIGSGMIGGGLAGLGVGAGLDVVLSNSRGPESLADLVARLGGRARAATVQETARDAELVVATIPLKNYGLLPADALAGKIVIDTMNYYPDRDGRIAALDTAEATSSELVQRHLAGARVVKAFNNIDFRRLSTSARPAGAPDRSALPIAGDDREAKDTVSRLLDVLGYDAVDLGGLADSWRTEPGTPVYVQPYMAERPEEMSQEETQRWFWETPGVPVSAAQVEDLVGRAVRRRAQDASTGGSAS